MADQAAEDDAESYLEARSPHGHMEIEEQDATYRAFDGLVRFGGLGIAGLLLFLVLEFCTKAGFFASAIVTAIVVAIGVFVLRKAPPSIDTL